MTFLVALCVRHKMSLRSVDFSHGCHDLGGGISIKMGNIKEIKCVVRQLTLMHGAVPTRASQNIRQESSPTLQNSCAL